MVRLMKVAMDVCAQMRGRNVEIGEEIEGLATEVDMKSSSRELFERASHVDPILADANAWCRPELGAKYAVSARPVQ
jgi:hypothetical protein